MEFRCDLDIDEGVDLAEHEAAAPLVVAQAPDVTTRVFMLFRGVRESDVEIWWGAGARAREHVTMWRDIVELDVEKATNTALFRALEWGGIELDESG